jgi:uncharacterized delta-60 repeat protein
VVAGYKDGDFALARYESSGALDTSFGTGGKVTTDFDGYEWNPTVAIQSDGKIVIAGGGGWADDFALARYEVSGTLDTTFGTGGKVETSFGNSAETARGVAIQSDGKIVVAGETVPYFGGDHDFALARCNTNGSLDTGFGTGGILTTSFTSNNDYGEAVAIQSDGKIVVAGAANATGNEIFALARYDVDGNLDTTFGTDGRVTTGFANGSWGEDVTIQSDGKIIVAGGDIYFTLARYEVNGTLDTSFGIGGKVTTDFGSFDSAQAIALQSDGKIVAAGEGANNFAVARYDTRVTGSTSVDQSETAIGNTGVSVTLQSGSCTVNVTKTIAFPGGSGDSGEMPMYWEITSDCTALYSLTLSLCYTEDELANGNGITETNLVMFRHDGSTWTNQGGTVDTEAKCVSKSGVSNLSDWTLGDPTSPGNGWPTAVELSSFTAAWSESRVVVEWETTLEIDTVGFNLYRSGAPDGEYVRLNDHLIPSQSPGSVFGATYTWLDEGVQIGTTYYYKLEDIEVGGQSTLYGPVSTSAGGQPTAVTVERFLPRSLFLIPLAVLPGLLTAGITLLYLARRRARS